MDASAQTGSHELTIPNDVSVLKLNISHLDLSDVCYVLYQRPESIPQAEGFIQYCTDTAFLWLSG